MKHPIALIHTSPAAIAPVVEYYGRMAPDLELTNLLDDGILRLFRAGRMEESLARLDAMTAGARDGYGVELALATCSAITPAMAAGMERRAGIPVVKIDQPMAQAAVAAGRRVGVAVTFPPTEPVTRALLLEEAARQGVEVQIDAAVCPAAYDALLAGDAARHDSLLIAAVGELAARGPDVIVLAQVSMARILPALAGKVAAPVLTSLETSLAAVRARLRIQP